MGFTRRMAALRVLIGLPEDACGCPVGLATRKAAAKAGSVEHILGQPETFAERVLLEGPSAHLNFDMLYIIAPSATPSLAPGRMNARRPNTPD